MFTLNITLSYVSKILMREIIYPVCGSYKWRRDVQLKIAVSRNALVCCDGRYRYEPFRGWVDSLKVSKKKKMFSVYSVEDILI